MHLGNNTEFYINDLSLAKDNAGFFRIFSVLNMELKRSTRKYIYRSSSSIHTQLHHGTTDHQHKLAGKSSYWHSTEQRRCHTSPTIAKAIVIELSRVKTATATPDGNAYRMPSAWCCPWALHTDTHTHTHK